MGSEAHIPPCPRPIPSPGRNQMTSQQKYFAKFTDELKQNHPLPLFHWKNEIGLLVEYHPQFGGSRV